MATNTFAYNGFGARVSKTDSSGSNTYLRASSGLIGSIVADGGATYTPGVSEKRGATSTFYHSDIKNSVEQTSTGQGVAASKQYDAFGNEVSSSGPWQGPFQYGGAFGYHTDTDYGLKHLGARYYDPTTGRFLSRDPIKDGRNWYGYCGGNPVAWIDISGEQPKKSQGWKDGPGGTKYREDLSQKPAPNLHIRYENGQESVISAKGGMRRTHNGQPTVPIPRKLRKAYRPIIRRFLKKALKRIPGVGLVFALHTLATEGAEAAVREVLMADEVEAAGGWLADRGNAFIENAQGDVEDWYNRRGGFSPGELAEYGLDY